MVRDVGVVLERRTACGLRRRAFLDMRDIETVVINEVGQRPGTPSSRCRRAHCWMQEGTRGGGDTAEGGGDGAADGCAPLDSMAPCRGARQRPGLPPCPGLPPFRA